MTIIYDLAAGFWTGRPWLVLREEGEVAVASFRREADARVYAAELDAEEAQASRAVTSPTANRGFPST